VLDDLGDRPRALRTPRGLLCFGQRLDALDEAAARLVDVSVDVRDA
jgi:hypothetical protein